jgi:hypothetical protein
MVVREIATGNTVLARDTPAKSTWAIDGLRWLPPSHHLKLTKTFRPNPEGTLGLSSELHRLACLLSPCTLLDGLVESYRRYTARLAVVVCAETASFLDLRCAEGPVNFVTGLSEV